MTVGCAGRLVGRLLKLPDSRGVRALAVSVVLSSLGQGLFTAAGTVYLATVVGLPTGRVGVVYACAGVLALAATLWLGRVVDWWGARRTTAAAGALAAAGFAVLLVAADFWLGLTAVMAIVVASRWERTSLSAAVAYMYPGGERVTVSALFRSLTNVGFALGSLMAAGAMTLGGRAPYAAVFAAGAFTQLVVASIRRAAVPGGTTPSRSRLTGLGALRDTPYLLVALLFGFAAADAAVLTVVLPLWIVRYTSLPKAAVGGAIFLNTLLVVGLQTRVAAEIEHTRQAGRALLAGSVATMAGFGAFAATGAMRNGPLAMCMLVAAVGFFTVSELFTSSAAWSCRFGFASDGAQGEYGALFQLGEGVVDAFVPAVLAFALQAWAGGVWALLAGVFAVIAVAGPRIIDFCASTRSSERHLVH